MVNKYWLFSDKFNRKHTASLAFVLFINTCFTCQIIRIVATDLNTVSMIFRLKRFFFVILEQLLEILTANLIEFYPLTFNGVSFLIPLLVPNLYTILT